MLADLHVHNTAPKDGAQAGAGQAFPLSLARRGETLRISAFLTGKGLGKRLGDLGLHEGTVIKVVHRDKKGAAVVMHNNNRIALGGSVSQMINVTLDPGGDADPCDGCNASLDQIAKEIGRK